MSSAVDRETSWLTSFGDGLPALVSDHGGPFDLVQAYLPNTPYQQKRALYVTRRRLVQPRFANVRIMNQHAFHLIVWWPLQDPGGSAENDQRGFDDAIDDVLARITGPLLDKTHGGRFLSVAEDPRTLDVAFDDPEQSIAVMGGLRATVTYGADDFDTSG